MLDYLKVAVSDAQSNLGIRRSKASKAPDLVPCPAPTVRENLILSTAKRANKAFRRHGEKSVQFQRVLRAYNRHVQKDRISKSFAAVAA